jgi:molybdate transport system permease protein
MDMDAILLSLKLALWTLVLILPFGVWVAHSLQKVDKSKSWIEAGLALPLVLPPTVLGYYLLVGLGGKSFLGVPLVFSFTGILIASLIVNLPFAIQPIQRAFEAINPEIIEAAQVSGLSNWQIFRLIELPLAWRGITSAAVLTFAHTLGEFGVVLMVGGAIPGETKTDQETANGEFNDAVPEAGLESAEAATTTFDESVIATNPCMIKFAAAITT